MPRNWRIHSGRVNYRVTAALLCITIAVICLWAVVNWNRPKAFKSGSDIVEDYGMWVRPRYKITLPTLQIKQEFGSAVFGLSNIPTADYVFYVRGVALADTNALNSKMGFKLRTASGRELHSVTSAILATWERQQTANIVGFWHPSLRGIRLNSTEVYELTIQVTCSPGSSNAFNLTIEPSFEGGGHELP